MHSVKHHPSQNRLLALLPTREFERIEADLELVHLALGEVVHESGCRLEWVYFPTTSIVSMLSVLEGGASTEIALVGNEGILGTSLFMSGESMPGRAVVQTSGWGFRLNAQAILAEFNRGGPMMGLLLRYSQALITQMAQTAVCNRHHGIEQQLCRWLLLSLDRLDSASLTMTQDLIASMLGVRREGITDAAGRLQKAGYIRYARGHITVLDRPGLEQRVCECYAVVRREFKRLLSDLPPGSPQPRGLGSQSAGRYLSDEVGTFAAGPGRRNG